jgi:pimeloyl-ACP methyl ester carboxylesterase
LIVLGSDDDPGLFQHADILSREIVGAKRATIAKTHHMPNIERPEAFNTLVLEFLGTQ